MTDEQQTTPEAQPEEAQTEAATAQEAPAGEAKTKEEAPAEEESPEEAAQPEAIAGVGLLIAAFTDEDAAEQALKAMKKAKKEKQFYYEAAAVVKKEADGDVHYHETADMSTKKGAGIGALIGGIVGVLGGPVGIALGAGAGAGIGAIAAHGDAGFRDSGLEQIGTALRPGSSAVMVITSKKFLKEFRKQVSDADFWPLMRSVGESISEAQAQGQQMVLGVLLTEEGLVVKRLAFDETTAQVFGFAVTGEGVAAGEAYADETGVIYQVGAATAEGTEVQTGVVTGEGAVIVNERTPAGSDETTVEVLAAVPEEEAPALEANQDAGEEAAETASADEAEASEQTEEEKPAEDGDQT